jgi:peptidoglycan/xylan/chitin deacetylase (PgdA/CDA1 family)
MAAARSAPRASLEPVRTGSTTPSGVTAEGGATTVDSDLGTTQLAGEEARPPYADGLIIEGGTPHRLILFTFDDGPDRRTTPLLLDRLDAVGVKAVFFLTASRIAGNTQAEREQIALAREIQARGHLIGSHTVDHLQLPLLDETKLREQVIGAEEIFERALGFRPTLFRPPGGAHSPRTDDFLAKRGYTSVLWNVGTGDFQVHSAQQVFDTFVKVLERRERENNERGGVVLMHDTYAWSVDAFQMIFAELWKRNCKLLGSGEELYDIVSDLDFFYQPRGDAEAGVLAEPARLPPEVLASRQARLRLEAAQRCNSTDGF